MGDRITGTKTLVTAWELVALLAAACPQNEFVVVLRSEDDDPAIWQTKAFHPDSRKRAKRVVAEYVAARLA